MNLENKVAIVTGAASGIGKEIAGSFAKAGVKVAIADISLASAQAAAREMAGEDGAALAVEMDVADQQAVDSGIEKVISTFGGVDILVSNAGIQHIEAVVDLSFSDWRKLMAIHLDGAFLTTRACLRHMYTMRRGGTILYMGSVHSKEGSALKAPYVAAKHALLGLCKVVAVEGAQFGVRANVICPGYVRTPLVAKQIPEQAAKLGLSEEEVVKKIMLKDTVDGEFTTSADIAEIALFLAGFPTNALTGQSIIASHGWHME